MNHDERIRRLEDDLYVARHTILELLPEPAQEILTSFLERNTPRERLSWEHDIVEEITALAVKIEGAASYWQPRAYCPLCGRGTTWAYSEGFTLPEGLRRHLTGWGKAQQCTVMGAAIKLAQSSWQRTRSELWNEMEQEEELARQQRRATEPQFQIALEGLPLLIDEGIDSYQPTRTTEQMEFAESRLRELGFARHEDGLVRSFRREIGDLILYADPRRAGRIDFRVFRKGARARDAHHSQDFSIPDRWVNRLEEKLIDAARSTFDSGPS